LPQLRRNQGERAALPPTAVEVAMGFSLLEISIVMACISLLGFLIADNLA
jgi:type II secretory pathway pseudopilin PulG